MLQSTTLFNMGCGGGGGGDGWEGKNVFNPFAILHLRSEYVFSKLFVYHVFKI